MREHAPLAAGPVHIENGVEDLAARVLGRLGSGLRRWHQGFQNLPLRVGQVGRVGFPLLEFHAPVPWAISRLDKLLDCDGVISWDDPEGKLTVQQRLRRDAIARLDGLVRRTRARVVVISTWRTVFSAAQLTRILESGGFTGAVMDTTPVRPDGERWREIKDWLDAQPVRPKAIAILEDSKPMGPLAPWLVQTDYDAGLQDDDVECAVSLLGKAGPVW
jgi:hypothetical protein